MLPFLIIGLVFAVIAVAVILKGPTKENETVNNIEERLRREREIAELKRKNDLEAERLEQERKRMQEAVERKRMQDAAERTRRLQDEVKRMHEAEIREQRAKVKTDRKVQDEEKRQRKKEERKAAREKEEEEARELEGRMEELRMREQMLKDEVEKVNQMAERERVARAATAHSGPLRWPTEDELQHARRVIKYDPANFHFAIVGRAGSGKSSLINAFRNLRNCDPGAAQAGTVETTLETGRYEDPGDEPPRKWMVWFDIPGAGTQRIPHHDYFIKQGLFIFDFIIVAIGDRFEEIDARILENCARFKIPAFIVRSKADMHILNTMKDYGHYGNINDDPNFYIKCRDTFVKGTQKTVSEGLVRQGLPNQPVYIVSRDALRETYNNSLQLSGGLESEGVPEDQIIHEGHLVKELLNAVARRRCDSVEQTVINRVNDTYAVAKERLNNLNLRLSNRFSTRQEAKPPRVMSPASSDTQQQHAYKDTRDNRKVIYPHQGTSAEELYDEITKHDPELSNMLVGNPIMFAPRVAMLTFYPLAPIPDRIYAFGALLRVEEYKEKERKKGAGRGGHTQTTEDKQKTGEGYNRNTASARGNANRGRGGRESRGVMGGREGRGGKGKGRGENKQGASHQRPVTPPPDYWGGGDGWDDDGWGGGGY